MHLVVIIKYFKETIVQIIFLKYKYLVLKRHKLSRSTSELKLRAENDENPEISSPIETGLTFDKWLAQKEKIKRIQKQQKLKEAQLSNSE